MISYDFQRVGSFSMGEKVFVLPGRSVYVLHRYFSRPKKGRVPIENPGKFGKMRIWGLGGSGAPFLL